MRRTIEILLVEDNPADVELTRAELERCHLVNNLHVAGDGVKAMQFLRREGDYENVPRPDLVLLDLALPYKDGYEVLEEIDEDPALQGIPVVVLTSSEADTDIVRAYNLSAACYVTKPVDLAKLLMIVKSIDGLGLAVVQDVLASNA